jgi:HAD superfamily hydrolase (TIGR01662 family)
MKKILICIDRDGTLIYDKKYHLGHQRNWKSLVRILPKVMSGLKLLKKKLPEAKIYFITNQPGVAVKDFPLLDEKKAHRVCDYVSKLFEKKGFKFNGYEICARASFAWEKSHPQFRLDKRLVGNFSCMKPRPGMINNIMKKERLRKRDTSIYIIGDRASDVETAKNLDVYGIFVPFVNRPDEKNKLKNLEYKKKYAAKDFLDGVRFIIKRERG